MSSYGFEDGMQFQKIHADMLFAVRTGKLRLVL